MQYGDSAGKIEKSFSFFPPDEEQAKRYAKIRAMAKDMGLMLDALCPAGREIPLPDETRRMRNVGA